MLCCLFKFIIRMIYELDKAYKIFDIKYLSDLLETVCDNNLFKLLFLFLLFCFIRRENQYF